MKILYFVPAAVHLIFYGGLGIAGGFGAIDPAAWLFTALLAAAGFLLFRGRWWGGVLGLAVGIAYLYMSARYTGQVIDIERPLGIALCIWYLLCGFAVRRKRRA